ncbi:hypothetical protein BKA81DRAFT_359720 [Phyllosticta paracitricarpa]|uniref:Secreted protein n=1 Tax=Phyllosticta paracitricarpa TaxID=2016321 RepID=A0ABR1N5M6_9PEZI
MSVACWLDLASLLSCCLCRATSSFETFDRSWQTIRMEGVRLSFFSLTFVLPALLSCHFFVGRAGKSEVFWCHHISSCLEPMMAFLSFEILPAAMSMFCKIVVWSAGQGRQGKSYIACMLREDINLSIAWRCPQSG